MPTLKITILMSIVEKMKVIESIEPSVGQFIDEKMRSPEDCQMLSSALIALALLRPVADACLSRSQARAPPVYLRAPS